MFSCFQGSRGSSHKKAKRGRLVCFWRRLIRPLTHFRHASRSEPKVCCENEQEPDSMPKHPRFDYKSREYVQQMIHYIPAAIQNRDHLCLDIFVAMYRTYATTWEVLDLLMKTYASFRPDCVEDQQTKRAIFSFLFGWFQKFPQDFYESPDLAVVSQFTEYVRLNVPSPDVDTQAREPPSMLEDQEAIALKLEEDPPGQDASGRQELALRPASETEPQGDEKPRENTELVKRAVLDPFEPKATIELLPTLDQALPTSADTHSPVDVAADEAADEAADVSPASDTIYLCFTCGLQL
uniref:RIKEN cDNA 1700123K08 gene n=1 Tax=Mus spicilegus TaxID=10103 RepID=A0A8C6IMI4_MUSSI